MKTVIIALSAGLLLLAACQKEECSLPEDCAALAGAQIISEEEKANACTYSDVYRYKGEFYTMYNCCVCDLVYMAYDCDGKALCALDENCMDDFSKQAQYLYSVADD